MNITDLKAGDTFYTVIGENVSKIEYLCLFPFHNPVNIGSYHIVIDKSTDDPIRIHKTTLEEWLANSFDNRPEAVKRSLDNKLSKIMRLYAFHESELDDYKDVEDSNGVKIEKGDMVSYNGHTYEVKENEVMLYIKTELQREVLGNIKHLISKI